MMIAPGTDEELLEDLKKATILISTGGTYTPEAIEMAAAKVDGVHAPVVILKRMPEGFMETMNAEYTPLERELVNYVEVVYFISPKDHIVPYLSARGNLVDILHKDKELLEAWVNLWKRAWDGDVFTMPWFWE